MSVPPHSAGEAVSPDTCTHLTGADHVASLTSALRSLDGQLDTLDRWGRLLADVLCGAGRGRLLAAGNGGSAAQAQHLTAELVGRYRADRPPFSAICLTAETSRLTPDAPVPVVEDVERRERPGGAALAAVIAAAATRREVVLVAPVDSDEGADRLRALLAGRVRLVEIPSSGGTAVKQRVRVGDHSVVRLDSGGASAVLGALPDDAAAVIRNAA